ncbi:hypothetical protein K490DRAFT_65643 [Saccharata proteae CBS 121410]|uniref:Small ribosomal subunit protein mS38 n=1 Tax=Saccharata proteae CBS 121410 TaxID=1314787 RepID=A0A9P4LV89_9PEZI|nr:hypothetical protein K490DRAFT_65643 [Saccharata proteae CBS 121410]
MFSPALGRAARTTCAKSSSSAISLRAGPSLIAANHIFTRAHQRRNSSTSCPPDNSRGAGSPQASTANATSKSAEKKAASRSRSKKVTSQQVNPPSVPPTSYLKHTDVALSSLFSCHRPISVTTSIPIASTEASFNSIFDIPAKGRSAKHGDVMHTLGNTVRQLESYVQPTEEGDVRAEIAQHQASGSGQVYHLDGAAPQNLNQLLAQMRPYSVPEPPQPLGKSESSADATESKETSESRTPQKRVWKTSVIITESTDASGAKTFEATSSPVIRLPTRNRAAAEEPASEKRPTIQQPFLERMEIREQEWKRFIERRMNERSRTPTMHAISVRRQRKLKMKKHKYKKLMKRTRNLRRKLGQT